jgi:hypothetical protein
MSTFVETLYRPIKIKDITNAGFELTTNSDDVTCFRIKASDIKEFVIKDKIQNFILSKVMNYKYSLDDDKFNPDSYYYLFPGTIFDRKSQDCTWSITRFAGNNPALQYLVKHLAKLGYKMKCDGQRFNPLELSVFDKQIEEIYEEIYESNLVK